MRSRLSASRRIGQYLSLAQRLGRSLRAKNGLGLRILTNDVQYLRQMIESRVRLDPAFEALFELEEIECGEDLPQTSQFFAAAHKVYAFRHLASNGRYSVLMDLDVLCVSQFDAQVIQWMREGRTLVFDISEDAFASSGRERVMNDLGRLLDHPVEARWYGGEFIAGDASFFSELFDGLGPVLARYRECYSQLCHQGDEIMVSAVLSASQSLRARAKDLSESLVIQRLWLVQDGQERHRLKRPVPNLLHLPALKPLLDSSLSDRQLLWLISLMDKCPGNLCRKMIRLGGLLMGRGGRGWTWGSARLD